MTFYGQSTRPSCRAWIKWLFITASRTEVERECAEEEGWKIRPRRVRTRHDARMTNNYVSRRHTARHRVIMSHTREICCVCKVRAVQCVVFIESSHIGRDGISSGEATAGHVRNLHSLISFLFRVQDVAVDWIFFDIYLGVFMGSCDNFA